MYFAYFFTFVILESDIVIFFIFFFQFLFNYQVILVLSKNQKTK